MQANFGPDGVFSSEEVLALCAETSEKYVPEPSKKEILSDILIMLKKFRNVARKREAKHLKMMAKIEQAKYEGSKGSESEVLDETKVKEIETEVFKFKSGLQTGLYAVFCNKEEKSGSIALENMLHRLEREILTELDERQEPNKNKRDERIQKIFEDLKFAEEVVVGTDKTNHVAIIRVEDYKRWIIEHLLKNANKVQRGEVLKLHKVAVEKAESLREVLNKGELTFLTKGIEARFLPTPQLLI